MPWLRSLLQLIFLWRTKPSGLFGRDNLSSYTVVRLWFYISPLQELRPYEKKKTKWEHISFRGWVSSVNLNNTVTGITNNSNETFVKCAPIWRRWEILALNLRLSQRWRRKFGELPSGIWRGITAVLRLPPICHSQVCYSEYRSITLSETSVTMYKTTGYEISDDSNLFLGLQSPVFEGGLDQTIYLLGRDDVPYIF
jgi:hypothetical protein